MLAEQFDEFLRNDKPEELNERLMDLLEQEGMDKLVAVLKHYHYELRVIPDMLYDSVMLVISAHARDRCSEYLGTIDSNVIAGMLSKGQLLSYHDMLKLGYRPHHKHQAFSRYIRLPDKGCVAVLSNGRSEDTDVWTLITIYNTISSNMLRIPEETISEGG